MWAQRETLWNTFCLDQVEVPLPKVYLLGNWNTDGSTILSPSQAALPMRFSCEFDSVIGAVLSSSTLSILIWNTSALPPDSSPELLMFLFFPLSLSLSLTYLTSRNRMVCEVELLIYFLRLLQWTTLEFWPTIRERSTTPVIVPTIINVFNFIQNKLHTNVRTIHTP